MHQEEEQIKKMYPCIFALSKLLLMATLSIVMLKKQCVEEPEFSQIMNASVQSQLLAEKCFKFLYLLLELLEN